MPRGVVSRVGIRARFTTASLVEQNHSVFRWVEEGRVSFGTITTRAAVKENRCPKLDCEDNVVRAVFVLTRLSIFFTILLVIQFVDIVNAQPV